MTPDPARRPALRLVPKQPTFETIELEADIRYYLVAVRQRGRVESTLLKYERRLSEFAAWLARRGVTRLADLDRTAVRAWGASLYDLSWSASTVRGAVAIVQAFLRWCRSEGLLRKDLAGCLAMPREKRQVLPTITPAQLVQMLDACDLTTPAGARVAALCALLYDTGLRASEVSRVRVDDLELDFLLGPVAVHFLEATGKGGHVDLVPFGDGAADLLRAWLKLRPAAPGVRALFVSLGGRSPGRPITRWTVGDLVRELGRSVGIECSPHSFRRGMATAMVASGASTRLTQMAGRWSDVRMVERYTRGLELLGSFGPYSPVDRAIKKSLDHHPGFSKNGKSGSIPQNS